MEWIKIARENIPEDGEVLAANFSIGTFGYKEKMIGYLGLVDGEIECENENEILNGATHYIDLNKHDLT